MMETGLPPCSHGSECPTWDLMFVELIQRCRQLFLMEADAAEDHVYQRPASCSPWRAVRVLCTRRREEGVAR